jgi:hypothetical protein
MGKFEPQTPAYMLPVALAKIPIGLVKILAEEAGCMWREWRGTNKMPSPKVMLNPKNAMTRRERMECARVQCSKEVGMPARYRLFFDIAAEFDRSFGGAMSAFGFPVSMPAAGEPEKPAKTMFHYTDCTVGDYHAKELADALEAHIASLMHMPLAEKGKLAGIIEDNGIPKPRRLCSELPPNTGSSLKDAGLEYEVILRRVISNDAAERYLHDSLRKAYTFAARAASRLGVRSSDLLAACLMHEKGIVEAMANSPCPFSLLGKVAVYEDNDRGRKTDRMPIVVIPGAETMHETHQWEHKHRKEYFCENGR